MDRICDNQSNGTMSSTSKKLLFGVIWQSAEQYEPLQPQKEEHVMVIQVNETQKTANKKSHSDVSPQAWCIKMMKTIPKQS